MTSDPPESRSERRIRQPTRAPLLFGILVGAALLLSGGYVVLADRAHRLEAAERQVRALAVGADRLVTLELRNIERALRGIAADLGTAVRPATGGSDEPIAAPPAGDTLAGGTLVENTLAGVMARQPELRDIVLVDTRGRALSSGRGDARWAQWPAARTGGQALALGPLERSGGEWVLPLAVPMEGGAVLARLRVAELQRLVASLDSGRDGRVRLLQGDGRVIADSRTPAYIGRRVRDLPSPAAADAIRLDADRRDPLDGVHRITAVARTSDYPLRVSIGRSRAAVLAPWQRLAAAAAALYLAYWLGLAHLVRLLRRGADARAGLLDRLQRTSERLRLAQRLGRTGTWTVERGGRIECSEQVCEILGLPCDRQDAQTSEFYERVHPDDRDAIAQRFADAWRTGEPVAVDFRVLGGGDGFRWVSVRGAATQPGDGLQRMSGTVVDISERIEAQQRLADAERHFRHLFDRNPMPFWVFDVETLRFLEVNDAAMRQYGYSREEFLAMTILDIRPPEQRKQALAVVREGAARPEMMGGRDWQHRRKDGSILDVRIYAADIDYRGRPARLVLAEDVTERVAQQRELAYRATHDASTGLLNGAAFAEAMVRTLPGGCTIAYAQVHGIEAIEDSLGRDAGEDTRRAVAERLERLGARYGAAGHIRTDEFALAVRDPCDWPDALLALQAELARPVQGRDQLQRLEAWCGSAVFPADGPDALQVVGNAALAAHLARTERHPHVRFAPEMAERAHHRLQLAGRIHQAIDGGEFELHFQVIRRVSDGTPAALEALLRWPQADGGFIPPGEFIGICEDSGLIVPLGRWVLREAARAQSRLAACGMPDLAVAVNVSLVQFLRGDLLADVDAVLDEFGVAERALHLELTESVLMQRPEQALATLRGLRQRGVCVSLDDFGTGFSSMSYLRHLPLDALKIDRSFVHEVDHDKRNASICLALLALGRNLGLTVVAEGVEDHAQLEWLRAHGCDQAQGFGLDRPAPLDDVMQRLGATRAASTTPSKHLHFGGARSARPPGS